MSRRTRLFVVAAAAVLATGLTTGLIASYMGLPVAFSQAAGPDELQHVPADAAVVAYANVREIMDSEFRERFRQFEPDTKARDEFEAKTGINIEQDINSVVAAMMPGAGEHGGMLVLARGRFNQAVLEGLALEHGGTASDYKGKRLLAVADDPGEPQMAIAFLDADLIAIGRVDAIHKSVDAGEGHNIVSNTEMMRQVNDLDAANAWAVGRFDAIAQRSQLPSELQQHLPAIQWFSAATHINGGVSGVFRAEARDDAAAQNMRDILRGFLAMARMQSASRPELKTMVDSLQLSGEGKNVAVSFTLPSELFDALQQLKQLEQGAAR